MHFGCRIVPSSISEACPLLSEPTSNLLEVGRFAAGPYFGRSGRKLTSEDQAET